MEERIIAEGNLLEELEEAEMVDAISEDTTPLSFTRDYGGVLTLFCC